MCQYKSFTKLDTFSICRTIDGVTYPGNIKEKEVAKKQYEKAVSRGQTAGLVR